VKLYCDTRNISTENIRLSQNNIVDPENRYQQIFKIQVELPADISEVDRRGILNSIERCTVKKVVQAGPEFVIEEVRIWMQTHSPCSRLKPTADARTFIQAKTCPWSKPLPTCRASWPTWASRLKLPRGATSFPMCGHLHIRDAHSPMCFTNGKGSTKESALASALGEYIERLEQQPFLCWRLLGRRHRQRRHLCITPTSAGSSQAKKMHCPKKFWTLLSPIYNPDGELRGSHLIDTNSGQVQRGICALPYVRQSDGAGGVLPVQPD
jgi:ribosomal protein S12 methylthiotransferase accessory factor